MLEEKLWRLSVRDDCDGDTAWGVEEAEWSESESKEVARLCMLRD